MSVTQPANAIYFPEGAGYLLVKVLQTRTDGANIESNVSLVKSLDDSKLYVRKTVELNQDSLSGIPNEVQFHPDFHLIPRVKDITKHVDSPCGEYYWTICTEFCNGGDLRSFLNSYEGKTDAKIPEILVWKFMADMIKTLSFLRDNEIEHKDIYPQNIFLRYPDEHSDACLPDFVLGDFGWAVPLKNRNRSEDAHLLADVLRFMYYGCGVFDLDLESDSGLDSDFDEADAHHLSQGLVSTIRTILDCVIDDLLTVDFLVNEILPHTENRIRQLQNEMPHERYLSSLLTTSKADNGSIWPEKLAGINDDWQLVSINDCPDNSGKITIQGHPRTTLNEKRRFNSFIRCTPAPVDLKLVYRFDAAGSGLAPLRPADFRLDRIFHDVAFWVSEKESLHDDIQEGVKKRHGSKRAKEWFHDPGMLTFRYVNVCSAQPLLNEAAARTDRKKRMCDEERLEMAVRQSLMCEAAPQKKLKRKSPSEDPTKVGVGQSFLSKTVVTNFDQIVTDHRAKVGIAPPAPDESDNLSDAVDLIDALLFDQADVLGVVIPAPEALYLGLKDAVAEGMGFNDGKSPIKAGIKLSLAQEDEETSPVEMDVEKTPVKTDADHPLATEQVTPSVQSNKAWTFFGASLLKCMTSIIPKLR
jgi:serine/threonine protein kinase